MVAAGCLRAGGLRAGGECFVRAIATWKPTVPAVDSPARLRSDVCDCRLCPRLVAWREEVAVTKRASYRDDLYWGRGVPGFGDPEAKILVLGLAPAAHGANRTGRIFEHDEKLV